jgi:ribonuclease P protein component
LGLVISKRVDKRAVERNRIRRLTREAFRTCDDLPCWDFVVLARRDAKGAENRILRESLHQHFTRLMSRAQSARHE